MKAERSAWQRYGWLLRWLGTAAGIAYIATLIDLGDVKTAFARISVAAWLGAIALVGLNVVIGAARWRAVVNARIAAYMSRRRVPAASRVRSNDLSTSA